jgi:hypothetical protein
VSSGVDLLRMLMPAVSPVPTQTTRQGKPPIESLSFESLLEEAKLPESQIEVRPTDAMSDKTPVTPPEDDKPAGQAMQANVLSRLTGIESIQNASLRRIVAEATGR